MIIRYIMECLIFIYIFGCCLYGWKKHVNGNKVVTWCIGLFIFGSVLLINVLQCSIVTEVFTLTVSNEKNIGSEGYDTYLYGLEIDRIEIDDVIIKNGNWVNDGENDIYSKQFEDVTEQIQIKVPVGKERKMIFTRTPSSGMVIVEGENEYKVLEDLHNEEVGLHKIDLSRSEDKLIIIDMGSKILLFALILLLFQIILYKIVQIIWAVVTDILSKKWIKYTIFMMTGFFIYFIRYASLPNGEKHGGYQNGYWFMNYELGFLSRGFIGEILCEISDYWTRKQLFMLKSVIAFSFFLIVSICVSKIIATWKDARMAYLAMGIVLAYPCAASVFRDDIRTDICIYLLYIVCAIVIYFAGPLMAFVPLFVAFIVFINETTCLTVVPSVFMLVIYKCCKTNEKRYKLLAGGILLVTVVCTLISVVYGKGGTVALNDNFENMQAHYEGSLYFGSLLAEYLEMKDHMNVIYDDYLAYWHTWLSVRLITLPMFAFMGMFFKNIYQKRIKDYGGYTKISYGLLILCSFSPISAMILATDHPRYFNLIFIFLITNIFFLMKEEELQITMDDMYLFTAPKKENYVPVCIVVFYFFIEAFAGTNQESLSELVRWFQYFENI